MKRQRRRSVDKKDRAVVGKFAVEDDGESFPRRWAVIAIHDNVWFTDVAYFKTKRAAVECTKRLRAALRSK